MDPIDSLAEKQSVCPSCGALIAVNEDFCPECNAPISLLANTDPLQSVYTEGMIYSRAVESRPKLVVVAGIWILFLPAAFLSLGMSISVVTSGIGSGASGFLFFWGGIFLSIFAIVMLYRVTRNYVKPPEKKRRKRS